MSHWALYKYIYFIFFWGGGGFDVCPAEHYIFSGNEVTPKKNILVAIISMPYYQAADWLVVSNSVYNQPHL